MTCCTNHATPTDHLARITLGRRSFVKLAAFAGGAALFQSIPTATRAAGAADALVLSCMDFRLADDVHAFMDSRGMTDKYDHLVLAGASAGVLHEDSAGWHDTFWTHLDVAIQLHGIHKVIVIDHRDCGAYKIAFGPEHAADAAAETTLHSEILSLLQATLKTRKPELEFEGYLMALDGTAKKLVGAA